MSQHSVQRWLLVDGSAEFGGHEVMVLRLAREVSRDARIHLQLLTREGSKLQRLAGAAAVPRALPHHPAVRSMAARVLDACRDACVFARTLLRERPDLCVIACGCLLAQPVYAPLARLLGVKVAIYVPIVDSARTMGFPTAKWRDGLMRLLYGNLPHAWITITRQQAASLRAWARVRRPILTLPNTIEPQLEEWARKARGRETTESTTLRALVLGRLEPQQKGLDMLLEYLERAQPQHVRIHFVGSGWYADRIRERMAANPRLQQVIELSAWSETRAMLQSHDVLLLTSRYEGVPLVMLEAMAAGVPVIASDLPGTRAFLPAECLFQVGDVDAAFAQLNLLRAAAHRDAIVARNRDVYWQSASNAMFSVAVGQLMQQLRELAGAADAASAATTLSASQRK
ncbi:MAG TPA: glycosyltransferase family 4 protein [Steroidobacteraceae bacterium]|nr:glycosyltransferase family 4 protein [Steroidobacteraceae bacterium]